MTTNSLVRTLSDDGTVDPNTDPRLSGGELRNLYEWMTRTRWLDERLTGLQRQGRVGFHVGSLGEEAAIIGAAAAMRKQDWIFPCYREFGAALMRGLPLQAFIDNMFGNANDMAKGRQMPDHYSNAENRFVSVSSPVGTQITQAVGVAWAAKLRGDDVASLVYFGDGATSSNDFHSGMNFAGVYQTPTVFLCRNNGWAISIPTASQTASETLAAKGVAYGIPAVRVDGNDLLAVYWVVQQAVARAQAGGGPTLIEALTYRMGGHSTSDDPNAYRGSEDLASWAQRDPIARVGRLLRKSGDWSDQQEEQFKAMLEVSFRESVAAAEGAPPPPLTSLFEDVYQRLPWHLEEQRKELLGGPRAPKSH